MTTAKRLVDDNEPDFGAVASLPATRQALVLEVAHDYLKHKHGYALEIDTEEKRQARHRELQLLRQLSKSTVAAPEASVTRPAPPEAGHGSTRVGVGAGAHSGQGWHGRLSIRSSLHDLLDPQPGFREDSQIEMSELTLRIVPQPRGRPTSTSQALQTLRLERVDLFNLLSLEPSTGWVRSPTWRVALGGGRVRDLSCSGWRCQAIDLHIGRGYALKSRVLGREVFYGTMDARAFAGPAFHPGYRLGVDAIVGMVAQVGSRVRLQAEGFYRLDLVGDTRAGRHVFGTQLATSLTLHRNASLRLMGFQERREREIAATLFAYF